MTTTVIHIRDAPKGWETNPQYTYIGRAGKGFDGKWGNPFPLKAEKDRGLVLALYRGWLLGQGQAHILRMVHDLDGQILVCFCKPLLCHGDVIIEVIEKFWKGEILAWKGTAMK